MTRPGSARSTARRQIPARVAAVVLVLAWGWLFYGLQDFLTPLVEGADFAADYLLETGWGLTFLVLVTVPLVVLAIRPGAVVALQQVAVVAFALALGALVAGSPAHLLPPLGLIVTALLLTALARASLRVPLVRPAPVTSLLAGAALVAAAPYAWRAARSPRLPNGTWGLDHQPVQAGFALALALVAVLAAFTTARCVGGRWLPAATVSFSAAWAGALSMVWPDRRASFGTLFGALAIVWAFALLAAVTVEGRRR